MTRCWMSQGHLLGVLGYPWDIPNSTTWNRMHERERERENPPLIGPCAQLAAGSAGCWRSQINERYPKIRKPGMGYPKTNKFKVEGIFLCPGISCIVPSNPGPDTVQLNQPECSLSLDNSAWFNPMIAAFRYPLHTPINGVLE
jgi:hypothetical protein